MFTAPQRHHKSISSLMNAPWIHIVAQRKLKTGDIFRKGCVLSAAASLMKIFENLSVCKAPLSCFSSCWLSQSLQGCHVCL